MTAAATAAPVVSARRAARPPLVTGPFVAVTAGTAVLVVASLLVGVYDVLGAQDGARMLLVTRVPRTVTLVLAGAVMAMAGLVMQGLTQNRFVEPTTTGTTEWAGLGLLAAMVLAPGAPLLVTMLAAVLSAFVGTMVFFVFLQRVTLRSSVVVPVVGLMLGAVVGAVSTLVALQTNLLQSMGVWFLGSFTSAIAGQYEPIWAVLIVVVAVAVAADRFTVAGLGREVSTSLGLDHRRTVLLGTVLIAAATGVVTVVVGNLPYLGLIVPNVVSLARGDDLRSNLPWVGVLGIGTVTAADLLGRLVVMPFEIPAATILSVVGAAVFVALLLRQRRRG